ncbi:MAG TPA: ATPase, T2SS/T4P/T4SS family [Thermoanaerobaculaceae bacterium]|nr:ATPase, T2SS/T4P/T4SS family [Thermoanaerobaculaceae bacterium]HPS78008.1 ATPase, T2SS/T4P/T4SS family [Thermoanaerobaculaceae bacterium]
MLSFDLPKFLTVITAAAPKAGDVLLAVGLPPQVQMDGKLVRLQMAGLESLTPFQTEAVVLHLLAVAPPSAAARVRQDGAASFAYSVPGVSRFRASVFSQRGTYAVSLRTIPESVPAIAELGLPEAMGEACRERNGIVLVNGPAGSGRSTSLAAMLTQINQSRSCHVVTVEDPIEFMHRHQEATINQREVGRDTPSLAQGMTDALRQGAQILLFSEPHTAEHTHLLLEAAETGHLVLTTLRAFDTASALRRLLSFFPVEEREDVRFRLSRTLRWSFTQQLLMLQSGRQPVVEIWRHTRATAAHLASAATLDSATMGDLLRDGEKDGLIGFDRELERRVRCGEVSIDAALSSAVLPQQIELRLLDLRGGKR